MIRMLLSFVKSGLVLLVALVLSACVSLPAGVKPVSGFELNRYLGTWYEIARLDHSFERGLQNVTATYSMRDDGGVSVINRGYSSDNTEWKEAEGKAYFVEDQDTGYLKVSFFGPFYGAYVVFELEAEGYQYAFVAGPSTDYLWLLARSPRVDDQLVESFKSRAEALGFDTSELILVKHDLSQ